MSIKPINFGSPMVRAIFEGRKMQTRRVLNDGQVYEDISSEAAEDFELRGWHIFRREDALCVARTKCTSGDLLWVRETWAHYQTVNYIRRPHGGAFAEVSDGLAGYRADGHDSIEDFREHVRMMSGCDLEAVEINGNCWRPLRRMPQWASRITLEVTGVRVERLQDISEADAVAEGVESDSDGWTDYLAPTVQCCGNARDSFATLWGSIYGEDAWAANPWVVAYEFKPILKNIDAVLAERGVAA